MRVQDEKDYESIYVCSSHMQHRIGEKEENKDKNKQKKKEQSTGDICQTSERNRTNEHEMYTHRGKRVHK